MESKSRAILAGVFSIGLLILTGLFALWLGKDEIIRTSYNIATSMKVSGLNDQAVVRYKGIKVGKVTSIRFDEKQAGQLLVQLDIVSDTPITQSTYATLGYQGVTGIAYIELDDDGSRPQPIIFDKKFGARIPLRPGLLQKLEDKGMAILDQTEELSKRLNQLLDKNNQASLVNTIEQIGKTAKAWEGIPLQLETTLSTLNPTIKQANESFASFNEFSKNAKQTSQQFNQLITNLQAKDGAIAQVTQSAVQLSNNLNNETLPNINAVSDEARATLRGIQRTATHLSDSPQSILFGNKALKPGPGEAGFSPDAVKK